MTVTDAQVRIMMRERNKGRTQEQAAASANVRSRQTVAKYEALGEFPSEQVAPRQYRTRTDVFAEDWSTLEAMLEAAPTLEAKALFEWLTEQHPGRYQEGQLRSTISRYERFPDFQMDRFQEYRKRQQSPQQPAETRRVTSYIREVRLYHE